MVLYHGVHVLVELVQKMLNAWSVEIPVGHSRMFKIAEKILGGRFATREEERADIEFTMHLYRIMAAERTREDLARHDQAQVFIYPSDEVDIACVSCSNVSTRRDLPRVI
jgi:hypothetical protein